MTRAQRIMLVVGLALLPVLIIGGLCWRWGRGSCRQSPFGPVTTGGFVKA